MNANAAAAADDEDTWLDKVVDDYLPGLHRAHLIVDGMTLVDHWPDGFAQGLEVSLGASVTAGFARFQLGVFETHGPASPLYCIVCAGTPIPVDETLFMGGVSLAFEVFIPFGPVQPFFGMRHVMGVGAGFTDPVAPSALLGLTVRAGAELPINDAFAVRLWAGPEMLLYRWVMGEPAPLPSSEELRASPSYNRFMFGVGLTRSFF